MTHFWTSRPQCGSLIILHEACRCLVVCKRGIWGLSRFGLKKSPEKRGVHSGPKDASSAYLFFIRARVRVRGRVRVRASRGLGPSGRVIKDANCGLGGPKCVKPIRKHHKYPPKVSPNAFGNFFFRSFFTPNRPNTAKSPRPPLAGS